MVCEYTTNTGDEIITKELSLNHVQQDITNKNLFQDDPPNNVSQIQQE